MSILVTGNAGFIGFHVTKKLMEKGENVIGLDSVNDYYDVKLKKDRLKYLEGIKKGSNYSYKFYKIDLQNKVKLDEIFRKEKIKKVVNLAAQAGVRYSIENPQSYIDSNITGFLNILECSKKYNVEDIVYASTSSIYGGNAKEVSSETDNTDSPIQFYAVTKKTNELMAHTYSHLFELRTTGLRFFTVYGPWGRPDMALSLFTKNIIDGKPIDVFNNGNHQRDFTFIDDIVNGIINALYRADHGINDKYKIYNIGNGKSIELKKYISEIEKNLVTKSKKNYLPIQPGDVVRSNADTSNLYKDLNFIPKTNIKTGIKKFIEWYLAYYKNR